MLLVLYMIIYLKNTVPVQLLNLVAVLFRTDVGYVRLFARSTESDPDMRGQRLEDAMRLRL